MTQSLLPAFIISSSLPDSLMSCCLICVTSRLKCCKCACSISPNSYFLFSTLDDITYRGCILSGSDGKESACSAGDTGLIPGSGRSSGEEDGYPLQYSCLENPMGRGIWRAYSLIGSKKSDTTEWLTLSFFFFFPTVEALLSTWHAGGESEYLKFQVENQLKPRNSSTVLCEQGICSSVSTL